MSINSSSESSLHSMLECFSSRGSTSIHTAFLISYILFLPLFILVLYAGYQKWRKQRSVATALITSHSDICTYNMVVLELIGFSGYCSCCYGIYSKQHTVLMVGLTIYSIVAPGQTLFHLVTCVERYLAVVHPITYLGLRQSGGVRNISIMCVWLLSFGTLVITRISYHFIVMYSFLFVVISSTVVSFCSISVLCVLIRPGPGEDGGKRERVDQSKQRAFHTIMAIMGALLLKLFSNLAVIALSALSVFSNKESCLVWISAEWFSLPSSLVLPLLFLQRAEKLPGCKHNTESKFNK